MATKWKFRSPELQRNGVSQGGEPGGRSRAGGQYLCAAGRRCSKLEAHRPEVLTVGSDLRGKRRPPNKALPQAFAECLPWPALAVSPGGWWRTKPGSCPHGAYILLGEPDKNTHDVLEIALKSQTMINATATVILGEVLESTMSCDCKSHLRRGHRKPRGQTALSRGIS